MDMKKAETCVKVMFVIRAILWVVALGATYYWIYWSFKLYTMEIFDVYSYGHYFRPIFARGLLITAICIGVSLILRSISDKLKRDYDIRKRYDDVEETEE